MRVIRVLAFVECKRAYWEGKRYFRVPEHLPPGVDFVSKIGAIMGSALQAVLSDGGLLFQWEISLITLPDGGKLADGCQVDELPVDRPITLKWKLPGKPVLTEGGK